MAEYQLCPKCKGQGTVSMPPWADGDIDEYIACSAYGGFVCDICDGLGLIVKPEFGEYGIDREFYC